MTALLSREKLEKWIADQAKDSDTAININANNRASRMVVLRRLEAAIQSGQLSPSSSCQGLLGCLDASKVIEAIADRMTEPQDPYGNGYFAALTHILNDVNSGKLNTRSHGGWKATDQQIQEWADRHDLRGSLYELRETFEDACTAHLLHNPKVPHE